jgi:Berberine and berberine like
LTGPAAHGNRRGHVEAEVDPSAFFDRQSLDRLRRVKEKYDPGNLFRANHEIGPVQDRTSEAESEHATIHPNCKSEGQAMTQQQREAIAGMLRASPFDPAGDLGEQRPLFDKMIAAAPVPADVVTTPGQLGGVPVIRGRLQYTQPLAVIPVRGRGRRAAGPHLPPRAGRRVLPGLPGPGGRPGADPDHRIVHDAGQARGPVWRGPGAGAGR